MCFEKRGQGEGQKRKVVVVHVYSKNKNTCMLKKLKSSHWLICYNVLESIWKIKYVGI